MSFKKKKGLRCFIDCFPIEIWNENVQLTQHVAAILIIRGRKVKHWGVAFHVM